MMNLRISTIPILLSVLSTTLVYACSIEQPSPDVAIAAVQTTDPRKSIQLEYYPSGALKSVVIADIDSTQLVSTRFMDSTGLVAFTSLRTGSRQRHGVEYYPNGRPRGLVNFDTTITGDAVYYHSNGQKRKEGRWSNGVQLGVWKQYGEDGTLTRTDTLE